jgi:GntR family transcriptional regulator, transcriptional repressor for pyruvate dehydrogenase complex
MEQDLAKGRVRYAVDCRFHTEIAAASHNTIFLHVVKSIYDLINYSVKFHREKIFVTGEAQRKIFDHYRRVFDAVRDREPDKAEAAMKEHLTFVMQELKKWLAERE